MNDREHEKLLERVANYMRKHNFDRFNIALSADDEIIADFWHSSTEYFLDIDDTDFVDTDDERKEYNYDELVSAIANPGSEAANDE